MFLLASIILTSGESILLVFAVKSSDLITYCPYKIFTSPDKCKIPSLFLICAVSELNLNTSLFTSEEIPLHGIITKKENINKRQ